MKFVGSNESRLGFVGDLYVDENGVEYIDPKSIYPYNHRLIRVPCNGEDVNPTTGTIRMHSLGIVGDYDWMFDND